MRGKQQYFKYDRNKTQMLSDLVIDNFDLFIEEMGIELKKKKKMYQGVCPIHNGDNKTALNIYHLQNHFLMRGNWKCRTHGCEEKYGKGIISFIRGVLDANTNQNVSFNKAISYVCSVLKLNYNTLKADIDLLEKRKFINQVASFAPSLNGKPTGITRERIRSRLEIPSQYYLSRGFSKEILDEYDIGLCMDPKKPMFNRTVIPIYDDNYKYMVGCTGRSVYEKCDKCKYFHKNHCPTNSYEEYRGLKWLHSKGFSAESYLFNLWKAKDVIKRTRLVIITEGVGDCLRLVQYGIKNTVSIFGTTLNNNQLMSLGASGALSMIVLMDNDEAGQKACERIKKQCERLYRLYFPKLIIANDVGGLNTDEITKELKSPMKQVYEYIEAMYKGK